jgi:hypothetical protein
MSTLTMVLVLLCVVLILGYIAVKRRIKAHRRSVARQLSLEHFRPAPGWRHHVLVLASDIHRGVIPALQYARTLSSDAQGVHVCEGEHDEARLRRRWVRWSRGTPLTILPTQNGSVIDTIFAYIDRLQQQEPNAMITVVLPELVASTWSASLLHGKTGRELKRKLRLKRGVVVTSIPYHIESFVKLPREPKAPKNLTTAAPEDSAPSPVNPSASATRTA